jgi:outer membrane protein assembly factor BamB
MGETSSEPGGLTAAQQGSEPVRLRADGFAVARFLVGCGLGAVVVVLFVGLWLPWRSDLSAWALLGSADSVGLFGRAWWVIVLVPVTLVLYLVALVWSRRWARLPLVLVTLVGTICALGSQGIVADDHLWIGWGVGAALIGYPLALLLSLALFVLSGRLRLVAGVRPSWVVAVLGVVPVVVAAGLVVAVGNAYPHRQVDATTAGRAVPAVTGAAGRVLWQSDVSALALGPVPLAGGLVVTGDPEAGEVAVLDAATGRQRWHYVRHDARPKSVTASRDQHTVLAVFETQARDTVLGFDALTGALRWQWWPPLDATQVVALSDVVVAVTPDDHGTAIAVDPVSGRQRWSLTNLWPAADDGTCQVPRAEAGDNGVAADGDLTVVLAACAGPPRLVLHAVDGSGHQRWTTTYRLKPFNSAPPLAELLGVSGGAVLLWTVAPDQVVALAPASGHVDWTVDSDVENWVAGDGDTVLLITHPLPGRLRQVNAATGTPTTVQPPPGLPVTDQNEIPPFVTNMLDGGTVGGDFAVRDGRAYLLSVRPAGGTALVVLDLRSERIVATYPVPATGLGAAHTGAAVVLGPGYVVVTTNPERPTGRLVNVALRLPGT